MPGPFHGLDDARPPARPATAGGVPARPWHSAALDLDEPGPPDFLPDGPALLYVHQDRTTDTRTVTREDQRGHPVQPVPCSRGQLPRSEPALSIPSLPTTVGEITFRSRLEARWSLVFTALGVPWEYEPPDGKYQLPSGMYWPDFRLFGGTDHEFWVEIKGPMPDSREFHVASELNLYVAPCVIFCGDLPRRTNGGTAWVFEPTGKRWIMRSPEEALILSMGLQDKIESLEWDTIISQARQARWDRLTGVQLEAQ